MNLSNKMNFLKFPYISGVGWGEVFNWNWNFHAQAKLLFSVSNLIGIILTMIRICKKCSKKLASLISVQERLRRREREIQFFYE